MVKVRIAGLGRLGKRHAEQLARRTRDPALDAVVVVMRIGLSDTRSLKSSQGETA